MADQLGFRSWAVTNAGNIVPTSAVEVRIKSSGGLATLFTDAAGTLGLANPFTAELDGSFEFFTERDLYDLLVGSGPSQETIPLNLSPVNSNGTWTPIPADAQAAGNVGTFLTSVGTFVKTGRLVTIAGTLINIDTTGMTQATSMWIQGIPFSCAADSEIRFVGTVQLILVTFVGIPDVLVRGGGSALQFGLSQSTLGTTLVQVEDFLNNADAKFSLTYETDE